MTSLESTTNFIDPLIVPGHVRGTFFDGDLGRFSSIPKSFSLPRFGVETLALEAETDETKSLAENGTGGRSLDVSVPSDEENDRAEEEDTGWEEECEVETDTLLGVDHRDLLKGERSQ